MGEIGWPEILIVILVLVLLFGAKKLPELARGSGRAIRIFKSETKGLMDDDEDEAEQAPAPKQLNQTTPPAAAPPQQTDTGQAPPPAPPMHTEN